MSDSPNLVPNGRYCAAGTTKPTVVVLEVTDAGPIRVMLEDYFRDVRRTR